MKLDGTATWIVGASSGIGAALAVELADRGARVGVSARRTEKLNTLTDFYPNIRAAEPVDVTDPEQTAAAHGRISRSLGAAPDLVVISAGYWKRSDGRAWEVGEFDRHLDVNLRGMSHVIAACLPGMLTRGRGTIVGVASVAGFRGIPGAEYYGSTKAAQIAVLESLRASVAARGVHVTTVCPGFVHTEMTRANDFPMPFMVGPEKAARIIADGIARDRNEIVFPIPTAVLMKTARLLPVSLWARLVRRR